MELLIFSDSHGRGRYMEQVLARQVKTPDAILFLGDGLRDLNEAARTGLPTYAVQGNCDWNGRLLDGNEAEREMTLSFEGHRLLLTHGHLYHVKSGLGALIMHAAETDSDIVLYGHTHTPKLERIDAGETVGGFRLTRPMQLFNPGSLAEGSFGTLALRGNQVLFSHGEL